MSTVLDHEDNMRRLTAIETSNQALNHRLYGNGQPGDIEKILNKLDTLQLLVHGMIGRIVGGFAIIAAAIPVLIWLFDRIGLGKS